MTRLAIITIVSIALLSCQKELSFEDNGGRPLGDYYLKCTIDGTGRMFSFSPAAVTYGYQAEDSVLTLMAFSSGDVNAQESISLSIYYTTATPGPGAYSESHSGNEYSVYGIYDADSTDISYTAGRASQSISPLQIVLATRTDTEITGTFSGTFYSMDRTTGEMHPEFITVTDGEFRLKVQ